MNESPVTAVSYEERERRFFDLLEPVVRAFLYFYSAASYLWGLVTGIVLTVSCKHPANKRLGVICIILALANVVFVVFCVAAYIVILAAGIMVMLGGAGAGNAGG